MGSHLNIDATPLPFLQAVAAHVELQKGERFELAELAANIL